MFGIFPLHVHGSTVSRFDIFPLLWFPHSNYVYAKLFHSYRRDLHLIVLYLLRIFVCLHLFRLNGSATRAPSSSVGWKKAETFLTWIADVNSYVMKIWMLYVTKIWIFTSRNYVPIWMCYLSAFILRVSSLTSEKDVDLKLNWIDLTFYFTVLRVATYRIVTEKRLSDSDTHRKIREWSTVGHRSIFQ